MPNETKKFQIEDAKLIFRNFSGNPTPFNPKGGVKSFCVILEPDIAEVLAKDGWNVKTLKPREDEEIEVGTPYINITVNFENRPPRVVMITSTARTPLNDKSVEVLDWAEIKTCDIIANAYDWEVGGKKGVKAYLQTMFVTIEEDDLERKYAYYESGT